MKTFKKSGVIVCAFLLSVLLCSCGQPVQREGEQKETPSMFVVIEETSSWGVVYHRDSKVMYAVSRGSYNAGTFEPLLNPDGTPMLWAD